MDLLDTKHINEISPVYQNNNTTNHTQIQERFPLGVDEENSKKDTNSNLKSHTICVLCLGR